MFSSARLSRSQAGPNFDIIRNAGLWDFAARAFPETEIAESAVCNSRRVTDDDVRQFCHRPIAFHVDSQFLYDDTLSINFWTPLVPCGVDAPGFESHFAWRAGDQRLS